MTNDITDHLIELVLEADREWARSEFPCPLLTLDFDAADKLIAIVAAGPLADKLRAAIDLLENTDG